MQFWWPFATKAAKNSWWWAERLPDTCRVVIPIKLEFSASVGFIHKEFVTIHGHTIVKLQYYNINREMYTFQINVLLQFFLSSTCFGHHVLTIRKTIYTCSFYSMLFMHLYNQSSRWKSRLPDCLRKCLENNIKKTACRNGLPDGEHVILV
jgi:hypothetical protein